MFYSSIGRFEVSEDGNSLQMRFIEWEKYSKVVKLDLSENRLGDSMQE